VEARQPGIIFHLTSHGRVPRHDGVYSTVASILASRDYHEVKDHWGQKVQSMSLHHRVLKSATKKISNLLFTSSIRGVLSSFHVYLPSHCLQAKPATEQKELKEP
jgi:hypothetical protein